jgi:hypothetical protein
MMFDLDTLEKTHMRILAAMPLVMATSVASAQTPTSEAELVTIENYNRAQADVYSQEWSSLAVSENSGMAASLPFPFSKAFPGPIATRYILSRYRTSTPGR